MMYVLPYYFCIASLTVLLIYRETHHSRIEKGLIDKILEQRGLDAIPVEHPLADAVTQLAKKADDDTAPPERVRLPIPGMAAFTHMAQLRARMGAKK